MRLIDYAFQWLCSLLITSGAVIVLLLVATLIKGGPAHIDFGQAPVALAVLVLCVCVRALLFSDQ